MTVTTITTDIAKGSAQCARPLNLSCTVWSGLVRLMHPRRNVPLAVQHTPHVDVVVSLDVENEVRVARQGPEAQAWEVQLVGIPG